MVWGLLALFNGNNLLTKAKWSKRIMIKYAIINYKLFIKINIEIYLKLQFYIYLLLLI